MQKSFCFHATVSYSSIYFTVFSLNWELYVLIFYKMKYFLNFLNNIYIGTDLYHNTISKKKKL